MLVVLNITTCEPFEISKYIRNRNTIQIKEELHEKNIMQREEKQLDMFLENSLIKLNDLKKAIGQMIHKIGES